MIIGIVTWDKFHRILSFKNVNALIAFFDFLHCCEKFHDNKEFSHGNSNLVSNHESQPINYNTALLWAQADVGLWIACLGLK